MENVPIHEFDLKGPSIRHYFSPIAPQWGSNLHFVRRCAGTAHGPIRHQSAFLKPMESTN